MKEVDLSANVQIANTQVKLPKKVPAKKKNQKRKKSSKPIFMHECNLLKSGLSTYVALDFMILPQYQHNTNFVYGLSYNSPMHRRHIEFDYRHQSYELIAFRVIIRRSKHEDR